MFTECYCEEKKVKRFFLLQFWNKISDTSYHVFHFFSGMSSQQLSGNSSALVFVKAKIYFNDSVSQWSRSCLDGLVYIYGSPMVVGVEKQFFFLKMAMDQTS